MNGHVKSMRFQQFMGPATTLLSLLLVMALTKSVAASRDRCDIPLHPALKLTRHIHKETVDLIQTYKSSQGEILDLPCTVSGSNIPDPSISGLEASDRIVNIYTHLQAFFPHFKRVYAQQKDLQLPSSPVLTELNSVWIRSDSLAKLINNIYQSIFPNRPVPEPVGGPTTLPPPQNIFQQKVYGCAVLKTYKEFLSNVSQNLRSLKREICRKRIRINT
ncbi:hypothetical protein EXN66_Car017735 [Channa argus]|uniref:Ciliary neurotrophic factor n=1 Tax=Channa argus TaxID=215402 RepID=A0A6G1QHV0_CHAAH|nr:hypothetical protein EXN66_Car017735 [Channa argus]KAK2888306.1 hypothetical protein Q8A73_019754 [Channa argus]